MDNRVFFDISTSKAYLSDILEQSLDHAVSSEPMEVNGVQIVLKRVGASEIHPEGKVAHEWIEKPVLEIGALNIPIETLVNLVLKHHESIITAKIDQSIRQFSDLNALLQKGLNDARDKVKSLDLKGNTLSFDINSIAMTIPYDFLEGEIKNRLQGMEVGGKYFDVDMIDIRGNQGLTVKMEISEPIRAQVFVTGVPHYDPSAGVLQLNNLDVKVNPANLYPLRYR